MKRIAISAAMLLSTLILTCCSRPKTTAADQMKPRLFVLTDIAPNRIEPDDLESLVRLLVHADLFEIEGLVLSSGWSSSGRAIPLEWMEQMHLAIDAYEKDVPNLMKRSGQTGFLPLEEEMKGQKIGYWPSPEYLRARAVVGSREMGFDKLSDTNRSDGSNLLISLADEDDPRPVFVATWGGANTVAQAVWQVQRDRSAEELKAFLQKIRINTVTDQDTGFMTKDNRASSHFWLRKEFAEDLAFYSDEVAWTRQWGTGRDNWKDYETHIQGKGHLGAIYPKFKNGVEGDTPSFLHILPNGLNDMDNLHHPSWCGYFEWETYADGETSCWSNRAEGASETATRYFTQFYPAIFNNFVARMDWAANGAGNRNPVVNINGNSISSPMTICASAGESVILDARSTMDPDNDSINFRWWHMPEAGNYEGRVSLDNSDGKIIEIAVPEDASGKSFTFVCEVTDDGKPALTSYKKITFVVK